MDVDLRAKAAFSDREILESFALLREADRVRLIRRAWGGEASEQHRVPIHEESAGVAQTPEPMRRGEIHAGNVERCFTYQPWLSSQAKVGGEVVAGFITLAQTILRLVPAGPDRSVALRKLREARMDVNSAITHQGEF